MSANTAVSALAEIEAMLARIRVLRGDRPFDELRQAFNAAADRLDVLASKLAHGTGSVTEQLTLTDGVPATLPSQPENWLERSEPDETDRFAMELARRKGGTPVGVTGTQGDKA